MVTVKRNAKGNSATVQRRARKRANAPTQHVNYKPYLIGLVLVLLALGVYAIIILTNANNNVPAGTLAPDFTLTDSSGRPIRLSDFRGKPAVLFFMITSDWCQPCKVETRDTLRPIQDDFGNRVQIISLELLPNDRTDADLNAYKASYGSTWIYARDTANVAPQYGVNSLSTIVVVDKAGFIKFSAKDPSYSQLAQVLRNLGA